MFFFIGGIQPKTIRMEKLARSCPQCGHHSVYKKRVDHYISLFFIPIVPVRKGHEFTVCENCQDTVDAAAGFVSPREREQPNRCSHCGGAVEQSFVYCPYCGGRLHR